MKRTKHLWRLMFVCGMAFINTIAFTTALAKGGDNNEYSPKSTKCYQSMGYCPSGMNYKCVIHKTAVYCYQYECTECEQDQEEDR